MKSRRGEKIKKKRSISGHELQQHLAGCLKNKEEMLGEMLTQGPGAIHHRHQHAGPTQAHGRARPPPLLRVFPLLEPQNIAQTGDLAPFFFHREHFQIGHGWVRRGEKRMVWASAWRKLAAFRLRRAARHRCRLAIAAGNCVSQARSGGLDKLCMSLVCWC